MLTNIVFILTGWILIVGVLRWSIVDLSHSVVHREMLRKSPFLARIISELFSVIFLTHTLEDYRRTHMKHHDPRVTFTPEDDDFKLLLSLGFKPGMSVNQLKKHFYHCLISPRFHWYMLVSRMCSNLGFGDSKTGNWRRIAAMLWISLIIYCAAFISLPVVIIGYLIPVIFVANCAALSQFATEHEWVLWDLEWVKNRLM